MPELLQSGISTAMRQDLASLRVTARMAFCPIPCFKKCRLCRDKPIKRWHQPIFLPNRLIRSNHPMPTVHKIYIVTILAKGLLGILQIAISAALYFGALQYIPRIVRTMVKHELSEDPDSFIATRILSFANIVPTTDSGFYTIYFAMHGLLHIAIVIALLSRVRWANNAAIGVLFIFVIYQLYEWFAIGGGMLLILTAIDLVVIYLTILENRRGRGHPA